VWKGTGEREENQKEKQRSRAHPGKVSLEKGVI
jgi:hypothetical protein